ncbi:hypothetical protein GCM10009687_60760 [Asanoa iriomotensis]|uniref:Uncharacterized protein n=1 Tax=Asanoa iriomotensis TaxID=234613 RepID=A0ABQ4C911_9ACTN|nr:hypothetical protein Air01nite_53680 [Asanoa iriomotensis]
MVVRGAVGFGGSRAVQADRPEGGWAVATAVVGAGPEGWCLVGVLYEKTSPYRLHPTAGPADDHGRKGVELHCWADRSMTGEPCWVERGRVGCPWQAPGDRMAVEAAA